MAKRTPTEAVRSLCLAFEGAEFSQSHGMSDFRIKGRVFAQYAVNHHGDGRVALWLNAPDGSQESYIAMDAESYFIPPYVGAKGWLGVKLDKNLNWEEIQFQVTEAFLHTSRSTDTVEDVMPDVPPPNAPIDPIEFSAFNDPACARRLEELRVLCFALPEVTETTVFGSPAFRAGKKTFVTMYLRGGIPCGEIWVGKEQPAILTVDARFTVPRYTGHNGWIQFKLQGEDCMELLGDLLINSYKHFALKRMLTAMNEG